MKKISLVLLLLFSTQVYSASITDAIIVDNKEWAQADLFLDLSWYDINVVCPDGPCGPGTLNGFDMVGWTWASRANVGDYLFAPYSPHPGGVGQFSSSGNHLDPWLSATGFRITGVDQPQDRVRQYVGGWASDGLGGQGGYAWITSAFHDSEPATSYIASNIFTPAYNSGPTTGGWFYRVVPLPSTVLLLGPGIVALLFRRKLS